jgi:hypothetical protein
MTLPWSGAKLLIYYLATNIAAQEIMNGEIKIPATVIPPEPPPIPEEHKDNPVFQQVYKKFVELHKEFLDSL